MPLGPSAPGSFKRLLGGFPTSPHPARHDPPDCQEQAADREQTKRRPCDEQVDPNIRALAPGFELKEGEDTPRHSEDEQGTTHGARKRECHQQPAERDEEGTSWMPNKWLC